MAGNHREERVEPPPTQLHSNTPSKEAKDTNNVEQPDTLTEINQWMETEDSPPTEAHGNPLTDEPKWIKQWLEKNDPDIYMHTQVLKKGYPNRWGARIELKHKWDIQLLGKLLEDYEDKEVVEWLKYGWPTGRLPTMTPPHKSAKNHKGATEFPQDMIKYISKEIQHGAVMGPYNKIPFESTVGISPLSSRPKKGSSDRRVILDLSFPPGAAINEGMIKDNYLGFPAVIKFPKTDELALRIFNLGRGCWMFKVDLSRYFRQLPLDPGDYPLIGYVIDGQLYFDKVLPMGMRTAPYIAQRVSNALAHIHKQLGFFLLNYVDDFVGAELKEQIRAAYKALTELLDQLRVDISPDKLVPPTTRLEFLGITFDSESMTMEVSPDKLQEIITETDRWLHKTAASRKEAESLIGKLQFVAKCVRAGRIFIARLINWIRGMSRRGQHTIPIEARKDIAWWGRFIHTYNGKSLLWLMKEPDTDAVIATDACLQGYGAIFESEKQYGRGRIPTALQHSNIAHLELLAVMIAVKTWGKLLKGRYFWIHVDNEAVSSILNSGASRDMTLQNILREIALIAAQHQFVIKARHIRGVDNRLPDWLSRWKKPTYKKLFHEAIRDGGWRQVRMPNCLIELTHKW